VAEQAQDQLEEQPEDELEEEPPQIDPEVAARRAAALSLVRKFGDPVLRTKARPVDRFDDMLRSEIERMGHLMHDSLGVGLAATQVGTLNRVLVYRVQPDGTIAALVNPEIEWKGKETETMEENGEPILIEASGLEARVIQHEIDHLDGVLILDRTSRDQRKEAMRTLREADAA
jgi:peptide deformylase